MRNRLMTRLRELPESGLRACSKVVPARRGVRASSSVVIAIMLVGGAVQIGVAQATALPADAAFRIGDRVVSQEQLNHRVDLLGALYGVQRPNDPAQVDRFDRDTAKAVAVSDILDQEAAERNMVIPDKAAADQLEKIVEQSFPAGRQDFIAKLGQVGASEQDVKGELKRQMANAKLFESVTKDVPGVDDADLRRTFEQRKEQMVAPEQRHLRNIVVPDQAAAATAQRRLAAGEDFAAVANDTSLDQSTKAQGGDLGKVAAEQLEPEYAKAAFGTPNGGLFGPLQTPAGWNVGQVVGIMPGKPLVFDEVKDQFRTKLNTERKLASWSKWLDGRIKSAGVEYADRYRPAQPDSEPNAQP